MYVLIQRIIRVVEEAAEPRPSRFDPRARLEQELQRLLIETPDDVVPEVLRAALRSGAVVGPHASEWLPHLRQWLTDECRRTSPGGD